MWRTDWRSNRDRAPDESEFILDVRDLQREPRCIPIGWTGVSLMAHIYKVLLVLTSHPAGGYTATCPVLPELITEGDTVEEALAHVQDAMAAVVELYEDLSQPLPAGLSRAIEPSR
jgi:antitoxin HicB